MSKRENIQPSGSLQVGEAPTSNSTAKEQVQGVRRGGEGQAQQCDLIQDNESLTHCSSRASGTSLSCGCCSRAAL